MKTNGDGKKISKKGIIIIVVMIILYLACYVGKSIYLEQYGIKPEIGKNEKGMYEIFNEYKLCRSQLIS